MKRKSLLLWGRCRGTRRMRFLQTKRFDLINLIHRKRSPFPKGKASINRAFWQQTEVQFVIVTTSGRRGRRPLQSGRITDGCTAVIPIFLGSSRAPTPTGKIEVFISATDGSGFCDHNDIGQSRTPVPTIDKERRRMHSGTPLYTLLIHRKRSPFSHKRRLTQIALLGNRRMCIL